MKYIVVAYFTTTLNFGKTRVLCHLSLEHCSQSVGSAAHESDPRHLPLQEDAFVVVVGGRGDVVHLQIHLTMQANKFDYPTKPKIIKVLLRTCGDYKIVFLKGLSVK